MLRVIIDGRTTRKITLASYPESIDDEVFYQYYYIGHFCTPHFWNDGYTPVRVSKM